MPGLPTTAVALAGTGGLGSGLVGWFLRHLLTSPTADPIVCQTAVDRAVELTQATCDRVISTSEAAFSEGLSSLVSQPSGEKLSILLVGICIGLCVFPLIDVLYILKSVWQDKVKAILQPRGGVHPVRRPISLPLTY